MDQDQSKVMRTLSDVTVGGRYIELEDGSIVPCPDEAAAKAAAIEANGQAGAVVGATTGEPSA